MHQTQAIERVVDLTDPQKSVLFNMGVDEARQLVASGDPDAVRRIDGQFALVATSGQVVRLARSIGRPLRLTIGTPRPSTGMRTTNRSAPALIRIASARASGRAETEASSIRSETVFSPR